MSSESKIIKPYRVTKGQNFWLKDFDPNDTGQLEDKAHAKSLLAKSVDRLSDLQEKLYAQDKWAVLLIFQAMDAAGKDGAIEHVMSGINPQGCQVFSFKTPSHEELDHDFLWRCQKCLPERGRIGVFNRSYYEETLVVRVHPEYLQGQRLPRVAKDIWSERFESIRDFEKHLSRNGVLIRKFFLNVSRKEQKKRFLARIDDPAKNWKFAAGDVKERKYWNAYMHAYEDMIQHTATDDAPWFVVPADNKWFTRLVVADAVIEALESIDLKFPQIDDAQKKQLASCRKMLTG